ncbi:putative efflux protein, MATE family [Cohaesibacter sp. ES.047]|uniref:MATE family efflux transporter n=1 Tax=Cohaesibacter sp. ES.047 TaxID=1798205 RepID=UPI000BB8BF18|nr:MATE family efflux transporter [Cohaesibacter sp. ES.047]SNY91906.1 putative efflux protein, MATE family [Cohaesibacter sp. ES.047]
MDAPAVDNPNAFDVTHHMVLTIAIPMTLGLVTVPIVGIVDMAVIGQLGEAHLMGGIAVGALLFSIVAASFNFLRIGTTGLTAQAVGRGDGVSQRAVLYRALLISLALGLIFAVASPLLVPLGLVAMGGSEAVNDAADSYLYIRLIALPLTLANTAIFGWLFGLGHSRKAMFLMIALNSANIVLTIWLVLGLDMGVEGAALGTAASELFAILLGFVFLAFELKLDWRVPLDRLFNGEAFLRFMQLNGDIFIRSMVLVLSVSVFTSLGARQGDSVLAANELLMHFFVFGGFFLDGIAAAAEQIGGRAIGANYRPAFDKTIRLTLIWGLALGLGLSLVMWLFGPAIIDLLTTAEDVRILARNYLVWAAVTPLIATLAFQMDGIFIGATWSAAMRNIMLLCSVIFLASAWGLMPFLGNHGLWLAMILMLASRGIGLSLLLPGQLGRSFGAPTGSTVKA